MTSERWEQIKSALAVALETDPGEMSSCLDRLCGDDRELRLEVENLLALKDDPELTLLESATVSPAMDQSAEAKSLWIGRRVGPYEIVEEIGSGGMGEVYRAVRADDAYRKEVAVKLLRLDFNSSFVVARFRSERQVLASLEHPNIARLLDGGSTEEGIPYFAMELIDGQPLYEYCDSHRLNTSARLHLFLQICSAVQYAHQRLIVHRDIKPGNILVTADGTPKLLDFGIAKILDATPQSNESTATMLRFLTPDYASPEQVRGEAVTTASDVYSLGFLLYEMLTGHRPYRALGDAPHEMARAICETVPERPSAIVLHAEQGPRSNATREITPAIVSALRDGTPQKLSRRLRGDLDNIVLTALRKEPGRRYASVEQFVEDIRRHLHNLPVFARRDTIPYRASKFITRHKLGIAAAAIIASVLMLGIIATMREARLAQRRFNDVRALANSLIFDVHDSIKDLPGSTPARKLIVDRALQYLYALAAESGGDIGLQRELATAYERVGVVQGQYIQDNLGDTAGSLSSYQKALELRKQINAKTNDWNDRLALAEAYRLVADLQWAMGKNRDARENVDRAVASAEALNSAYPNNSKILYELGIDYAESRQIGYPGDPDEDSKRLGDLRKSLATDDRALKIKPDDVSFLHAYTVDLANLAVATQDTDPMAALTYAQQAAGIEQKLTERSNASRYARELAIAYLNIATAYDKIGDYPRAAENNQKYLAMYIKLQASDPKNALLRQGLAIAYVNTADALAKVGQTGSAVEDWSKGVEIMRDVVASAPENVRQRHKLGEIIAEGGSVLMRAHQPRAALQQFEQAHNIYQSLGPKSDYDFTNVAECTEKMGQAAALDGDFRSATSYFHQALTVLDPLISSQNAGLGALYAAADTYSGLGDFSLRKARASKRDRADWIEARSWYAKSLDTWHRIAHPNHTGPNGMEVQDPAIVARKLKQCEAALKGH